MVKPSYAPLYFRNGERFRTMKENNEEVSVPLNCFKETAEIENLDDVQHLLSTLAFWKVDGLSAVLVQYCIEHFVDRDKFAVIFAPFESQLTYLTFLFDLMEHLCFCAVDCKKYTNEAIDWRNICWSHRVEMDAIKICGILFSEGHSPVWGTKATAFAARCGQLKTLAFLHELDCPWDASTCTLAAQSNSLECLRYAHEHGCPWAENTLTYAISSGPHVDCVKYAIENRCPGYKRACEAVADDLARLKCAHAAGALLTPACYEKAVSKVACVRYLHENSTPWHRETCTWAVRQGNAESLHYAHVRGAVWSFATVSTAAHLGEVECLRYSLQNGCPSWSLFQPLICTTAATADHVNCLACAHENGCKWDSNTCTAAAKAGHLDCLTYLHESGCPWDELTSEAASRNCHDADCLRYAHEHDCPWDGRVLKSCYRWETECSLYAKKHGCPTTVWFEEVVNWCTVCVLMLAKAVCVVTVVYVVVMGGANVSQYELCKTPKQCL